MTTKAKLAIGASAALVLVLWLRRRASAGGITCESADAFVKDGVCVRRGFVESLFDEASAASDQPVAFDDFGSPLITRPSQL